MVKDQFGRRAATGTSQKQPTRGSAVVVHAGNGRPADAWLAAVVFGSHETKVPVNIRLDADIVSFFRAGGPGYQTRINDVLKAFVQARIRADDIPDAPPKTRVNGKKRAT